MIQLNDEEENKEKYNKERTERKSVKERERLTFFFFF